MDDPKRYRKQQEAAEREAQRLIKNFKEIQRKADKKSKKKEKDIEQEIRKMEVGGVHFSNVLEYHTQSVYKRDEFKSFF